MKTLTTKKPTLILLATMTCLALTANVALAEQHAAAPHDSNDAAAKCEHDKAHRHHRRHGHHARRYGSKSGEDAEAMRARFAGLKLSDTQKQEMASLMGIYGPRFKELRERGEAGRRELMQAAPDADNYRQLTEQVSADAASAAAETVVLLAELQANAYALLTAEQQAEYMAMKAKARERMEEWRAKRAEARKASSGKGYSRKARPGHGQMPGAPETPPSPPQ